MPAPTIVTPAVDADVFNWVDATGTGVSGATVTADVQVDGVSFGSTDVTVDDDGTWTARVPYDNVAPTDALELVVTQERNGFGSPSATVALTQVPVNVVSGVFSVAGNAGLNGTPIYIRAYTGETEPLDFVAEYTQALETSTQNDDNPWSFEVPDGDWTVRIFVDRGGNFPEPDVSDALPQLTEHQDWTNITVSGAPVADLDLTATFALDPFLFYLNVVVRNDRARELNDGSTCGGYVLTMDQYWPSSFGAAPQVIAPDGSTYTPLNDGGCQTSSTSNASGSYDLFAGDGISTLGIPEPSPDLAGRWHMSFIEPGSGHLGVAVDDIEAIVKLPTVIPIHQDFAANGLNDLNPTFTWDPVPGATHYLVRATAIGTGNQTKVTTEPSVTFDEPLLDDHVYALTVTPGVGDPSPGNDGALDAVGVAAFRSNRFVTDVDGDSTIVIGGALAAPPGYPAGPFLVRAYLHPGGGDDEAIVLLPEGSESYQLTVFERESCGLEEMRVNVLLDLNASGFFEEGESNGYSAVFDPCADDSTLDVIVPFPPPPPIPSPVLLTPVAGATVTTTPVLTWEPYETTIDNLPDEEFPFVGEWHYRVMGLATDTDHCGVEGLLSFAWAIPPTETSFDFGNLPTDRFDLFSIPFYQDAYPGCMSTTDLSQGTTWLVYVAVIGCAYDDGDCLLAGPATASSLPSSVTAQ